MHAFAAAARRLAHRGPDASGLLVVPEASAVLAFRRLSIIDLANGDQPMSTTLGHHLVFNGEIYNYRDLRRRLEAEGRQFRTASDTEVLLRCIEHHGTSALSSLAGMFAFAYLDAAAQRLVLARDRLGVKQLYYADTADGFFFASEPKALLALPWVRAELATEQLPTYVALRTVPGQATLFRGISRLEAGTVLTRDLRTGLCERHRYWRPAARPEPAARMPLPQAVDRFEDALLTAVRRRLVADVPVGAFLSGGLDSSLIVAAMRRAGHADVQTFNAAFPGSPDDESHLATAVAQRFGTRHVTVPATPDAFLAALPRWIHLNDDLVGDASSLPLLHVSDAARGAGCLVMLSGEGSDELFGGYGSYHKFVALRRASRLVPTARAREWLARAMAGAGAFGAQDLPRVRAYFVRRGPYLGTAALADASDLRALFTPDAWNAARTPPRAAGAALDDLGAFDLATRIPDDLLVRTDRATMGASIEARVPFLDHELVELVLTLPRSARARLGVSKVVPRLLARRWGVPAGTILHRKIGFQLPLGDWMRGPLAPAWRDILRRRAVPGLRYDAVARLYDAHLRGAGRHEEMLWRLMALEFWYTHHVLGDAAPASDAGPLPEEAAACAS